MALKRIGVLILVVFLSIYTQLYAQTLSNVAAKFVDYSFMDNTIGYDFDRHLRLADFQKRPPKNSGQIQAATASGIYFEMDTETFNGKKQHFVKVAPVFQKLESWFKKSSDEAYVLLHEQKHFDITAIKAFELVDSLNLINGNVSQDHITAVFNYFVQLEKQMQMDYDRQTLNGRDRQMQAEWNQKIDDQIQKFKHKYARE
jgi:hypothetical protein